MYHRSLGWSSGRFFDCCMESIGQIHLFTGVRRHVRAMAGASLLPLHGEATSALQKERGMCLVMVRGETLCCIKIVSIVNENHIDRNQGSRRINEDIASLKFRWTPLPLTPAPPCPRKMANLIYIS